MHYTVPYDTNSRCLSNKSWGAGISLRSQHNTYQRRAWSSLNCLKRCLNSEGIPHKRFHVWSLHTKWKIIQYETVIELATKWHRNWNTSINHKLTRWRGSTYKVKTNVSAICHKTIEKAEDVTNILKKRQSHGAIWLIESFKVHNLVLFYFQCCLHKMLSNSHSSVKVSLQHTTGSADNSLSLSLSSSLSLFLSLSTPSADTTPLLFLSLCPPPSLSLSLTLSFSVCLSLVRALECSTHEHGFEPCLCQQVFRLDCRACLAINVNMQQAKMFKSLSYASHGWFSGKCGLVDNRTFHHWNEADM